MRTAARHRVDLQSVLHQPVDTRPCTRSTVRCADARSYFAELRSCCRGHVIELVAAVQSAFDDVGITWWADYGTLLGAVRNPLTTWADYPWLVQEGRASGPIAPGIIPHDKDADVGVLAIDRPQALIAADRLRRRGHQVVVRHHESSMKVRLSRMNHTNVDVFFWRERPDGTLFRNRYIEVDKCKGRDFPMAMVTPLSTVPWESLTLPAPADPAAFCAFRYGETWRTPVSANTDGRPR